VRRLLSYARPHTGALVLATLLGLLASGAGLAQPLVAKAVIDALGADGSLVGPVVLLASLVVLGAVLGAGNNWLLGRTAERVVLQVRRGLADRLVRLRVAELDRSAPGDLISRATADSSLLRSATTSALVDLINGTVGLLGALALMGYLDLRLLAVSMSVLAGVGLIVGVVVPRIRRALLAAQEAVGAVGSALDRALGAARTVKSSGAERSETAAVDRSAQEAYDAGLRSVKYNALVAVVSGLSIQVPFLAVLGTGGMLVARGELPVSTLIAFLLYLFYLIGPIGQVVGGLTTLQQGLGAVDRIRTVEEMAVEDDVPGPPVPAPGDGVPAAAGDPAPLPVSFEGVTFGYPGRGPVLRDVTFEAPGPGLTAVVGPSGAGKSTLFSLLMRFYDLDGGRIRVGGLDVSTMPRPQLRRLIGYVEQDAPALSGTVAENLRYAAPDATDEQVAQVLALTRLDELMDRLPDGEQTVVGTRGVLLSGGERQRLAIARALLRRPAVLLLDEATSQLDARNEQALRTVVQQVAQQRTVVVVAHRLSTVTAADRIVVLDAGRVRATGSHAELLAGDPLYAELAATQLLTAAAPD
jgi:ABC-type multidrug transport system fused ATPase/permease subunit